MKHYVITRFNTSLYSEWEVVRDKLREAYVSSPDEWMEKRLNLFNSFTLPSMNHQTCQDFKWVIFMDVKTPLKFRKIIFNLFNNIICKMKFYFLEPKKGAIVETLKKMIKDEVDNDSEMVITSRLDNDDAWNINKIKEIQQVARPGVLIDYAICFWYDFLFEEMYINKSAPVEDTSKKKGSPCISMVETKKTGIETIWRTPHPHLTKFYDEENIIMIDKPYDLMVVHGDNLANCRALKKVKHDGLRIDLESFEWKNFGIGV